MGWAGRTRHVGERLLPRAASAGVSLCGLSLAPGLAFEESNDADDAGTYDPANHPDHDPGSETLARRHAERGECGHSGGEEFCGCHDDNAYFHSATPEPECPGDLRQWC